MSSEATQIILLREALEAAHEGLKWYRDRHPEDVDGSDDEMDVQIAVALEFQPEKTSTAPYKVVGVVTDYTGRNRDVPVITWTDTPPIDAVLCFLDFEASEPAQAEAPPYWHEARASSLRAHGLTEADLIHRSTQTKASSEREALSAAQRNAIIDSMGWALDGQERGDMHRLVQATCAALATHPELAADREDAEKYRLVRHGQHWSVIDGIGNTLRGDDLDNVIDSIMAARAALARREKS